MLLSMGVGTSAERIADMLAWFPTDTTMPFKASVETAIVATIDLANALRHPSPASPMCPVSDSQCAQLQQLADIFHQHTQAPPLPPSASPSYTLMHPLHAPFQHALPSPTVHPSTIPSGIPTMAPLQRMAPHIVPGDVPTTVPHPRVAPSTAPSVAPPPRVVPTPTTAMMLPSLTPPTRPLPTISWDTAVTGGLAPVAMYDTSTINPGQLRQKATKVQVEAAHKAAQYAISKILFPKEYGTATWTKCRTNKTRSRWRHNEQTLPTSSRASHTPLCINQHTANFPVMHGLWRPSAYIKQRSNV
jgi:hypothetical protein